MNMIAQLLDYLAYPIAAGVTVAIIIGIWQLLHTRPLLAVSYAAGGGMSSSPESGIHRHTWKGTLTFHNPTAYDMYAIKCISVLPKLLPIPASPKTMPAHNDPVDIPYDITKEWPEKEIFPDKFPHDIQNPPKSVRDVHNELFPMELRSFRACFRYENKWGLPYYTLLKKEGGNQSCTHHRCRPQK